MFIALLFVLASEIPTAASSQEVLVEAPRLEKDRLDPSRSVQVVTEQDIVKANAVTVADVLRHATGVQLFRQGAIGQTTSAFIRGARAEATLVLIDGIEMNDASAPAGGYDFSTLAASHIERIEIYRGPQSVRFGANALGGVINIITKEGREGFKREYLLEGGSYRTRRAVLQGSGGSKTLGGAFALDGIQSEGFSAAAGGREPDGAEIYSTSAKFNWHFSRSSDLSSSLRFSRALVDLDRQGGSAGDDPNEKSLSDQLGAGFLGRHRFLEGRIKTSAALFFSEYKRQIQNDPDSINTISSRDQFLGQNLKAQVDADLLVGDNSTIQSSLQWRRERAHSDSEISGVTTSVPDKSRTILGESVTYLFESESWFSDLGIRYDEISQGGGIWSTRGSAGRIFSVSSTKVTFTYGTGFKTPSLFQLYSIYGNESLALEKSNTVDLSVEQSLSDRAVLTITGFESRYAQLIDFDPTMNRYFNVANAEGRGVESEIKIRLGTDSSLDLTYTYLETRDLSSGLRLLRRPLHSISASASHQLDSVEMSLRYLYRGSRPDIDPTTFQRVEIAAYDVFDLSVSYVLSPKFKLSARIENALDRVYEEVAGYGVPGRSFFVGFSGGI